MDNARNVIARAIVDQEYPAGAWNLLASSQLRWLEQADAIIAALADAGYEIVKRDAPHPKPEPDWGRRGTQPTGTLGPPPPPNGKLVATKPKPE